MIKLNISIDDTTIKSIIDTEIYYEVKRAIQDATKEAMKECLKENAHYFEEQIKLRINKFTE